MRLIIVLMVLSGSAMAEASERLRVQAGWLLNGEYAAFCSAIVTGIYGKHGLEVELIPGGPTGAGFIVATTALAQDSRIDIAIDGDLVPLIRGSAHPPDRRINVKAFASFWTEAPFGFLVREDSGIESLQDLARGRPDGSSYRVGVTADFVLQEVLARHGDVRAEDIEFVTVGFDTANELSDVWLAGRGWRRARGWRTIDRPEELMRRLRLVLRPWLQ